MTKNIRDYLKEIDYKGDQYDVNIILRSIYQEVIKLNPQELMELMDNKNLCHLVPLAKVFAELTDSSRV